MIHRSQFRLGISDVRDLQNEFRITASEIDIADDHLLAAQHFCKRERLEYTDASNLVIKNHPIIVEKQPAPLAPVAGERAVRLVVEAAQARIVKTVRARPGPARRDRVGEEPLADQLRVRAVAAVVNDAAPIDEPVAAPRRGHAQRVGLEYHEFAAFGHAARPVVEPDRDALVGDIARGDLD